MIQIPNLKQGDSVYILSTARKISKEELDPAIKVLTAWGLNVILGKTIGAENHQMAGTDELKIADFNEAISNTTVKAILCARGGYGTVRIIDQIDWKAFSKTPKWVIGYSDVTTLHGHLNRLGYPSIHATMPINFKTNTSEALDSLKQTLFKGGVQYKAGEVHRTGQAEGQLIGGNLSILYSLLGSPSSVNTDGKILFMEDLDEYLYHIDRMMMNLKRNGYFENLAGLVIGGMTDMNDNAIPFGKSALEIIFEHIEPYSFPVIYNFPAGHLDDNRALIMGYEYEMNASGQEVSLKTKYTSQD